MSTPDLNEVVAKGTICDLKKLKLSTHDVVLDIGGNVGHVANYLSGVSGSVHAFEPNILCHKEFEHRNRNNNNVILYKEAITSHGNDITLELNEERIEQKYYGSGSVKKGSKNKRGAIDVCSAKSRRFCDVVEKISPTCIKIDIEGGEYDILANHKIPMSIKHLQIEFHSLTSTRNSFNFPIILAILISNGFGVVSRNMKNIYLDMEANRLRKVGFWEEMAFSRDSNLAEAPSPAILDLFRNLPQYYNLHKHKDWAQFANCIKKADPKNSLAQWSSMEASP